MKIYKKQDSDGQERIYIECDFCGEIPIGETVIVGNQRLCVFCNSVVGYVWDGINV